MAMNFTISLDDKSKQRIEHLRDKIYKVSSMAKAIKRSLALMSRISEYTNNGELVVLWKNKDGNEKEIVFILDE